MTQFPLEAKRLPRAGGLPTLVPEQQSGDGRQEQGGEPERGHGEAAGSGGAGSG